MRYIEVKLAGAATWTTMVSGAWGLGDTWDKVRCGSRHLHVGKRIVEARLRDDIMGELDHVIHQ